jgi:dTDP-4-amino-4,6-dideoxygalactose transaminase
MKMASVAHPGLAVEGGAPVRTTPFPAWPQISRDEIEGAAAVLASGKINYWTGEEGRRFEEEFAASIGRKRAIALANGSVALELALHALGIGPGDEVIVPSRSFIASACCVSMLGANPVFADVDRESGNVTAETLAPHISRKTKAIIVVHLGGWPCEMDPISTLAREHGLKIVEDCAQAQGARYKTNPIGSLSGAAIFSFCQDKIMTTGGEGGMLVTDDEALFRRAWSFKDHGKSYDAVFEREHPSGFRWLHESIGTNWRMSEMQSAMGRVMLPKVPQRVEQRRKNSAILFKGFSSIKALRAPQPPAETEAAFYRVYAYVRPELLAAGWNRDRVQAAIEAEGIPCFSGSCSEIYLEKAFAGIAPRQRFAIARELGETSLAFLVHHTLGESEMSDTLAAVEKVFQRASK